MSKQSKDLTAESIVDELIATIEPLKVSDARNKPEKFVNVGIEAVRRLFIDNKSLILDRIDKLMDQQTADLTERISELEKWDELQSKQISDLTERLAKYEQQFTPLLNQLFAENSELKDRVAELESENERQQSEITDWVYNSEQLCLQRDTLQTTLETEQANLSREKKMFERVLGEKEEAIAGLKATLEQINKIAGKQYYNELAKVEEWNNDQFAGIEFPYKGKPDKPEIVRICLEALAQLNPIKGNNDQNH